MQHFKTQFCVFKHTLGGFKLKDSFARIQMHFLQFATTIRNTTFLIYGPNSPKTKNVNDFGRHKEKNIHGGFKLKSFLPKL